MKKRLKYEKPVALDMGSMSLVHGADCSSGFAASNSCVNVGHKPDDGCGMGDDPDLVPACEPGNTATTNCMSTGSTAGQFCSPGGAASIACFAGSDPG